MGQQAFQMVLFLQNIAKELRMLSNSTIQSSLLSEQLKKTSNVSLGEAQKQKEEYDPAAGCGVRYLEEYDPAGF